MQCGRIIIFQIIANKYYQMGTVCITQQQKKVQFIAQFSANLRQLFDYYKHILEFLKPSNLFAASSQELTLLVDSYLENPKNFSNKNVGLCAVDSVNKLHPLVYGTENVTKQWLINACIRQNKFIQDFSYQLLDFEECYRHYVQFIYMCFKSPDSIIIPNKMADFMWHSHMQDNYRYQKDIVKMLGKVLDHFDDMTPQEMEQNLKKTEQARKRLLKVPQRRGSIVPSRNSTKPVSYHQYGFINYGPGYCGGVLPNPPNPNSPHPPRPHSSSSDSSHSEKGGHHPHPHPYPHPHPEPYPHYDHHSHHKQEKHHDHQSNNHQLYESHNHHNYDTSNHGNYDTHNHSSCGGGVSSCGGGASSCGGGGSSCGGGGSD